MARNKNSTALFDVIHAAKKPPKASPSASIPTPKWWGKDRKERKIPQPVATASTENVGRQQSWLTAAKKSNIAPVADGLAAAPALHTNDTDTPATPPVVNSTEAGVFEGTSKAAAPQPAKTRFLDRFVNRTAPAIQPGNSASAPEEAVSQDDSTVQHAVGSSIADRDASLAGGSESSLDPSEAHIRAAPSILASPSASQDWKDSEFVQLKPAAPKAPVVREAVFRVDPAAKEFRFRLSYGGLLAIGFIFLMALAIAFIAGSRTATETAQAENPSTARGSTGMTAGTSGLMAAVGPAKPGTGNANNMLPVSLNVLNVGRRTAKPAASDKPPTTDPANVSATPPAALMPLKNNREIGLMYVIVQSYAEHDVAQKACDFVNQQGIECTVVQGPSDWAPRDWYSVISMQSFTKHDAALPDFERRLKAIGAKFSPNVLNQFYDPRAYTWRQDSDLGQP